MYWIITTCAAIALIMFTYHLENKTGEEYKTSRILALVALGLSLGNLYANYIAV